MTMTTTVDCAMHEKTIDDIADQMQKVINI
jgi:hypothetical protein